MPDASLKDTKQNQRSIQEETKCGVGLHMVLSGQKLMLFDVNWSAQHGWSNRRRQSLLHTESELLMGFRKGSNTEGACFHPHPSKLADFHCILKFAPPLFFSSQPAFSPLWFVSWIDLVNDLEPFSFKELPIIKGAEGETGN